MLVLTRTKGQEVLLGPSIKVVVLSTAKGRVKLGIEAPELIKVLRGELQEQCRTCEDCPLGHIRLDGEDK
jgi:carbon storage regulator